MLFYLALGGLWGCSANQAYRELGPIAATAPSVSELVAVPFFPQEDFQCGPAALAAVLNWAGAAVTPETLAPQVQLDARRGSLQLELLAATRRHGLLPYVHGSGFEGLLRQLQAGVPALVLLNLGVSFAPTWHYAVVVGYSAETEKVLLRSGHNRLQMLPLRDFARSWAYSRQWFMTAQAPGNIPVDVAPAAYLSAVTGLERAGQWQSAMMAYDASADQWPDNWLVWMGRANLHYQLERFAEAERDYRRALSLAPQHPAAHHNLAWALLRQGRRSEAEVYARQAAGLSSAAVYQSALAELRGQSQYTPASDTLDRP